MTSSPNVDCPLCRGTTANPERRLAGYPLLRCIACGFVFMWPRPSREQSRGSYEAGARGADSGVAAPDGDAGQELMDEYDAEYTPYVKQALTARLRRVAGGQRVRRMLDFGCGSGHLLGLARDVLRCETHGVELHPVGRLGAQRFGFDLHAGALEKAPYEHGSFDLVYASQVFEHLPDPRAELDTLHTLLTPGGRLYIEVPNYGSISIRVGRDQFVSNVPPGHVNYFTPATLRRLVEDAGLTVLQLRTTGFNYRALLGRERPVEDAPHGDAAPQDRRTSSSTLRTNMLGFVDRILSIPGWGRQVEVVARRSGVAGAALILTLWSIASGCGGTRSQVTAAGDSAAPSGNVSYEFIVSEGAGKAELPENQELEAPRVIDAPMPEYPGEALLAGAPPTTVAVRFLVRPDGTVGDVGLSPLEKSTSEPPAEEFWRAAEAAVRRWSFVPGKIRMFKPGPDIDGDGTSDYRIQTQAAAIGVYYHVRFRFEVVDGVGHVRMGSDAVSPEPELEPESEPQPEP